MVQDFSKSRNCENNLAADFPRQYEAHELAQLRRDLEAGSIEGMTRLVRGLLTVAKFRQKMRRKLWRRGAKVLDRFAPRDFLAAAAVEQFGQYSSQVPIFEYLLSRKSIDASETVSVAMSASYVQSLKNALVETIEIQEQVLILNHFRVRNKSFVCDAAEKFRLHISLFVRDKPDVPSAHFLETQMSQACMCAYLMLLRLRRYGQLQDFVEFAAIQVAAVMILADKRQI
jgi:hypothetical protein